MFFSFSALYMRIKSITHHQTFYIKCNKQWFLHINFFPISKNKNGCWIFYNYVIKVNGVKIRQVPIKLLEKLTIFDLNSLSLSFSSNFSSSSNVFIGKFHVITSLLEIIRQERYESFNYFIVFSILVIL